MTTTTPELREAFNAKLAAILTTNFATEPTPITERRMYLEERIAVQAARTTSKGIFVNQDDTSVLYLVAVALFDELAANPGAISQQEVLEVWREAEVSEFEHLTGITEDEYND